MAQDRSKEKPLAMHEILSDGDLDITKNANLKDKMVEREIDIPPMQVAGG